MLFEPGYCGGGFQTIRFESVLRVSKIEELHIVNAFYLFIETTAKFVFFQVISQNQSTKYKYICIHHS